MKRILLCTACITAFLGAAAREYLPVLEDGKSWTIGRYGYDYASRKDFSHLEAPYLKFEVTGDTVILGKPCKIVTCGNTNYFLYEETGKLYYYHEFQKYTGPGSAYEKAAGFSEYADFNAQVGDSLRCYYSEDLLHEENPYRTYVPTNVATVTDLNGTERKEIQFRLDERHFDFNHYLLSDSETAFSDRYVPFVSQEPKPRGFSWVEGIGITRSDKALSRSAIMAANGLPPGFHFIVECQKDGKTIFRNSDFGVKADYGLLSARTIVPGRSWTVEQNGKQFTVAVERDTCVVVHIPNAYDSRYIFRVLSSSDGREFLATENDDYIYCYSKSLEEKEDATDGIENKYVHNALPIVQFNKTDRSNTRKIVGLDFDDLSICPKFHVSDIQTLTVNGNDFLEYTVTGEGTGERFSWVEGVGAADSNAWISVMPAGHEYKLIDCRQDDEVIFTADDFSIPSTMQSSITEIAAPAAGGAVYDLQGRRVTNPTRGLYIINGHKTLLH